MGPPRRLAAGERRFGNIERVRQVIDARHQVGGKGLAVDGDAADGNAAEADPVIAAFSPDESNALRLSARAPTSRRGAALNCRFAVNGIHSESVSGSGIALELIATPV